MAPAGMTRGGRQYTDGLFAIERPDRRPVCSRGKGVSRWKTRTGWKGSDSMASAFASKVRSSVMRRGMRPIGLRAVYAFRGACMHPYASGDAYMPVLRFGLFPAFRGGLHACMHCMHHSLIGDSGKGRKPLILMHTMHTRERNSVLSFIYKGFRAFSKLFLYASPDAYKCIHAYRTGRGDVTIGCTDGRCTATPGRW